jgi:hypothetical protein
MQSPKTLSQYLATYITDKAAIAAHVSREFGKAYTTADVLRMLEPHRLASIPRPKRTVGEPIGWERGISTRKSGFDPLAKALFAYHAKRTSGDVKAYWEAKL